ncbi:hypothetical protein M3J09_011405 [Ascochyta lentis]
MVHTVIAPKRGSRSNLAQRQSVALSNNTVAREKKKAEATGLEGEHAQTPRPSPLGVLLLLAMIPFAQRPCFPMSNGLGFASLGSWHQRVCFISCSQWSTDSASLHSGRQLPCLAPTTPQEPPRLHNPHAELQRRVMTRSWVLRHGNRLDTADRHMPVSLKHSMYNNTL